MVYRKPKIICGNIKNLFFLNLGLSFITVCHSTNYSQTLITPHYIFCDWWGFMGNTWKVQRDQHWLATDHLLYASHCSLLTMHEPRPTGHHNDSCLKPVPAVIAQCLMTPMWLLALTSALSWLLTCWQGCWWHLNPASANIFDMFRASFWLVNLPFK